MWDCGLDKVGLKAEQGPAGVGITSACRLPRQEGIRYRSEEQAADGYLKLF
jgi:hypothetical protein